VAETWVTFSSGDAAADLWAFGEDDLAYAALDVTEEQLAEAWRCASRYYEPAFHLPVEGRRITLGHVTAFSMMTVLEGGVRPLRRQRRRPAKGMPTEIVEARNAPRPSLTEIMRVLGD
jgi:hypothetical protein